MADVVVIGGGPAGLSAALFLAKAGRRTVVVDTGRTLIKRADLRNYLGFPDGIAGNDLLARGREQVEKFGGTFVEGKQVEIERSERGFIVVVGEERVTARNVVLATAYGVELAEQLGCRLARGSQTQAVRIVEVDREGRTSVPGVWAAGVVAGMPVQTIVAAGDGARIAVNLLSELRGSPYVDHDVLRTAPRKPATETPAATEPISR
jgi:thioredoxin reductase